MVPIAPNLKSSRCGMSVISCGGYILQVLQAVVSFYTVFVVNLNPWFGFALKSQRDKAVYRVLVPLSANYKHNPFIPIPS